MEASERLFLEEFELEKEFLSHLLSLQVDGDEDYKIPIQELAIYILKK